MYKKYYYLACLFIIGCALMPVTQGANVNSESPYLSADSQERFRTILFSNGECKLPCLFGVVPGETDWDYTKDILNSLHDIETVNDGFYENTTWPIYGYPLSLIDSNNRSVLTSLDVTIDDGLVQRMNLRAETITADDMNEYYNYYSTRRIFLEKGLPDNIFVDIYMNDIKKYPGYDLLVVYEKEKLAFWLAGESRGGKICPSIQENGEITNFQISVANPQSTLDTLPPNWEFWSSRNSANFLTTQAVFGLSKEELYEQLLVDKVDCFNVILTPKL